MLVVDDSVVVRRLVVNALSQEPDVHVVGAAVNGRVALDKVALLAPDVVVLDIEMPVLDGIATLRRLRAEHPQLAVIMFTSPGEHTADQLLDAFSAGASDYVAKPAGALTALAARDEVRAQLLPRIRAVHRQPSAFDAPDGTPAARRRSLDPGAPPYAVLGVGASTGGPDALAALLPALGANLGVPVVVVQHMPPNFTALFARRLDAMSAMTVREAADGDLLRPGEVLIAPGDRHLVLERDDDRVRARLDRGAPVNYCRPSVDVLFRSIAEVYGRRGLAVVLTGMGHDGAHGAELLAAVGGTVLVQDEATSVVWGMPGAVVANGHHELALPIEELAPAVTGLLRTERPLSPPLRGPR